MALPVAHALSGASIAALLSPDQTTGQNLKTLLICGALAIVPDFDYLFYEGLGWGESWHRSFSHSIVFAVIVGAITAAAFGPFTPRFFIIYSLAIFSHPVLDAIISEYPSGVEFFWPLSTRRIAFAVVDYPSIFGRSRDPYAAAMRFLKISFFELVLFSPVLLVSLWLGREIRAIRSKYF
jgi:membrane-bound metal-dependent hydrolase YbcI (DUF457 family)